jgi:hypothetical protein
MKVKSSIFIVMSCVGLLLCSSDCYARVSSSLDLLNNAKQYDNKTVTYKGEVIGDVMIRGDHAWLHVNDGAMAIGVWAPKTLIPIIRYSGNYQIRGDAVEVSGMFHRSCPEHGGDLDIHVSGIRQITAGSPVMRPISKKKVRAGAYSLMLVMLFIALQKLFQKNRGRF